MGCLDVASPQVKVLHCIFKNVYCVFKSLELRYITCITDNLIQTFGRPPINTFSTGFQGNHNQQDQLELTMDPRALNCLEIRGKEDTSSKQTRNERRAFFSVAVLICVCLCVLQGSRHRDSGFA